MNKRLALVCLALGLVSAPVAVVRGMDVAAVATATADVSGVWDVVLETPQGTGTPVFTLQQNGTRITGTYKGQLGQAPVTGRIDGATVHFSVTVNSGEPVKIEYTGTVDGGTMKGTAKIGTDSDGTFTARRRTK